MPTVSTGVVDEAVWLMTAKLAPSVEAAGEADDGIVAMSVPVPLFTGGTIVAE